MLDIHSVFVVSGGLAIALTLAGCQRPPQPDETIRLQLYQQWQVQPGDILNGVAVIGGLGDIGLSLNGQSVYAPFAGRAQKDPRNCLIFSTPDVPAYLFRLCGLSDLRLGTRNQGEALGTATILHVATLRKQPNGTWAIVEPSKPIIERFLTRS
jgi:hypothetical protein